ncbi:HupE/UreJ family protein [Streptomyces sp. NPDC002640]
MPRLPHRLAALLALVAALFATGLLRPAPAAAHDATTTAYAEVTGPGPGGRVTAVLDLEYDLLMKSAWLYAEAYEAKGRQEQLRQLALHADAVHGYVTQRFTLARDNRPCAVTPAGEADVHSRGGRAFALLTLAYSCPAQDGPYTVTSALFPDAETFVHSTETVVRLDLAGETDSRLLTAAEPSLRAGGGSDGGTARQIGEFFVLGAEHLLLGPDHVLFLLALLLGARGLRDVLLAAGAFAAAHSVTFLLASTGTVTVPAAVVEPVIAGSIAVVAVVDVALLRADPAGALARRAARWRLPVVFVFGLVHGLGFAGALGIDESWSWELLLSLLSFNVGIEAAQLLVIAVAFPLLALVRRTPAHRWVLPALAVPVTLTALYWLTTRVAGIA